MKELDARRLLSKHIISIAQVVSNFGRQLKLQKCLENIGNTRPITLFAGRFAQTYINEALAGRINDELRKLDLYHIRAGVSSTGDAGSIRLGVLLFDSRLNPSLVLSEAEQRMCAVAYFFADAGRVEHVFRLVLVTSLVLTTISIATWVAWSSSYPNA